MDGKYSINNKAVCMVGEVPQNTHKVAGFYISLPDELAGGEKSVMLSEHPFPQDTQHKMKQVTLYVEGQKTQAAGVIRASLETIVHAHLLCYNQNVYIRQNRR